MKLKDQVVSLKLAKKLKQLDVDAVSLFRYVKSNIDGRILLVRSAHKRKTIAYAYTVAELGEMLPMVVRDKNDDWEANILFSCSDNSFMPEILKNKVKKYKVWYEDSFDGEYVGFINEKEADARATMLIHLKENNLII